MSDVATIGIKIETQGSDRARMSLNDLASTGKRAEDAVSGLQGASERAQRSLATLGTAAAGVVAGMGVRELITLSDQFTKYTAQLKLATNSTFEYANAMAQVRSIANSAQQDLASVGTLFARIANGTRELGLSQQRMAAITETVSLSLKVSGAAASESASAMLQLSQAFASGQLRGEEFNAVNEAAPRLMKALADGIGVPVGALRELASQGKITSEIMANALPRALQELREEAKSVQTIAGAFTVLKNNVLEFVGAQAQSSSAVSVLTAGIEGLANNLNLITAAAGGIAASKMAETILGIASATTKGVSSTIAYADALTAQRTAAIAAAQAEVSAATATAARLEATQAAIVVAREEYATKLASANATIATSRASLQQAAATIASSSASLQAAQAAGALSFALSVARESSVALAGAQAAQVASTEALSIAERQRVASLAELAVLGQQQVRVSAQVTAVTTAQAAAQAALATATGAGGAAAGLATRALGLLGGPIGAITTLLGLGATAWMLWGNSSKDSQTKASDAVEQSTAEIIANLNKQNEKLRERIALGKQLGLALGQEPSDAQRRQGQLRGQIDNLMAGRGADGGAPPPEAARVALLQTLLGLYGQLETEISANTSLKGEDEAAKSANALFEARMRLLGVNKQYYDDLKLYHDELKAGRMTNEAYVAAVSKLATKTYESSEAGKADAEAKREAEAASRKAESALKKEEGAYATLITQINQVIAKNREEIEGRKNLTDSQKLDIALTESLKSGKKSITAAHEAELRARIAIVRAQETSIARTKAEIDAINGRIQVEDERKKAESDRLRSIEALDAALMRMRMNTADDTKRLELEAKLIGATNVQRQIALKLFDLQIEKEKELEKIKNTDMTEAERDIRRELVNTDFAKRAANIAGKAYLDEWQKTVDQVETWFVDSFTRMLTDGKDGWESFCKSLKNSFLTLVVKEVYKAFAQPFVVKIVASLLGITGLNSAQAASQAASGGGNILSSLGSGYSMLSSLGAFGGGMSAGFGGLLGSLGLSATGTTLGGSLSAGAIALQSGNILGGLGTFVGALGPIVAGLGVAAALLGDAFSTRGANHGGLAYSTSGMSTADTAQMLAGNLGWKDPVEDFTVRGNTDKDAAKQFKTTIDGLLDMYKALADVARGPTKELDVVAGFATNPQYKDESSYGYFQILDKVTGELLQSYTNRDMSEDGQKAWTQYVADLGKGMIDQLRGADIPSWMNTILDDLGETPSFENLQAAVAQILAIDQAFKTWSENVVGFAGLTDKLQESLLNAAGGLEQLSAAVNTYYSNFYSPEEQLANTKKTLEKQLADLGLSFDLSNGEAAKAAFRKAVEDALAAGNTELAYQLMKLAGTFAYVADAAEEATKKAEEEAKAKEEEAKRSADEMARIREEEKKKAWDAAMGNLNAAISREKEYWSQFSNDAKDALSKASSYFDLFSNSAKSLRDSVEDVASMQAAAGMVFIENALENARRGLGLPDLDKSKNAITAATGGLVMDNYASQAELDYDKKVLAGQLSELGDYADLAKTDAQKQLDLATSQLKRLDDIQKFWADYGKDQIDATLSTTDAVNALYKLLDPAEQAKVREEKAKQEASGAVSTKPTYSGGAALGGTVAGKPNGPQVIGYTDDGRTMYSNGEVSQYAAGEIAYSSDSGVNLNFNRMTPEELQRIKTTGRDRYGDQYTYDEQRKAWMKVGGSFAVGTNWVPNDMFAQIHEGERIVPKADNQALIYALQNQGSGNVEVVQAIDRLQRQVEELTEQNARLTEYARRMDDNLNQATEGGNAMRTIAMQ
ncbi:hypothetical protein GCM10027082_24670 [Comamonas humi]